MLPQLCQWQLSFTNPFCTDMAKNRDHFKRIYGYVQVQKTNCELTSKGFKLWSAAESVRDMGQQHLLCRQWLRLHHSEAPAKKTLIYSGMLVLKSACPGILYTWNKGGQFNRVIKLWHKWHCELPIKTYAGCNSSIHCFWFSVALCEKKWKPAIVSNLLNCVLKR